MRHTCHIQKHAVIKGSIHNPETIRVLNILFSQRDSTGSVHSTHKMEKDSVKILFLVTIGYRPKDFL